MLRHLNISTRLGLTLLLLCVAGGVGIYGTDVNHDATTSMTGSVRKNGIAYVQGPFGRRPIRPQPPVTGGKNATSSPLRTATPKPAIC